MPPIWALITAALASVPGLLLSFAIVSGRNMRSLEQFLDGFMAVALWYLPLYLIGAFIYGALLWYVLRLLGALNLFAFLLGAVIPVAVVLIIDGLVNRFAPGTLVAFIAFAIPALVMGLALWACAVKWRLGS